MRKGTKHTEETKEKIRKKTKESLKNSLKKKGNRIDSFVITGMDNLENLLK